MNSYQPDPPRDPLDVALISQAGPEPQFDAVTADFLHAGYSELTQACGDDSLVRSRSFGRRVPWLYRLDFRTRGLARADDGQIVEVEDHAVLLRFLPDCLRRADRFQMLHYAGPHEPWHPNIAPGGRGAICLEVYPGEPVLEIVASVGDLIRWRIRELRETDALNKDACAYGRTFVERALDDRPLFGGPAWTLQLGPEESVP